MCISVKGTLIMKAALSFFLTIFVAILSLVSHADSQTDDAMDYCYKPSKPLILASAEYKNRYAEDVKEYQRCRKGFIEMQARVASLREESEKNARDIRESFVIRHY